MTQRLENRFGLNGKSVVVTGATGFLGRIHCDAIAQSGGVPVILDLNETDISKFVADLNTKYNCGAIGLPCDITNKSRIEECLNEIIVRRGSVEGLVNNAANDPKVGAGDQLDASY